MSNQNVESPIAEEDMMDAAALAKLRFNGSGKKDDAGTLAKERLAKRVNNIKKAAVRTYMVIMTLVVLIIGGVIGYLCWEYSKIQPVRYTDYRPCSYVDERNGIEITGRREFSYMKHSFFGIEFRKEGEVSEKTQIDIKGDVITVVGLTSDGKWWGKFSDLGERGILMLNPADTYVITTKKAAAVIDYAGFCR